jgi:hypothetical protein
MLCKQALKLDRFSFKAHLKDLLSFRNFSRNGGKLGKADEVEIGRVSEIPLYMKQTVYLTNPR